MLSRMEAKIMDYLFERCRGKKSVLVTPKEILHALMPKYEITAKQLDGILKNLVIDGYLELTSSDKKGQPVYVVALKDRGAAYEREKAERRKRLVRSVGWKVLLTLIGFGITYALWEIFRR